jgi:hypothetical protein
MPAQQHPHLRQIPILHGVDEPEIFVGCGCADNHKQCERRRGQKIVAIVLV